MDTPATLQKRPASSPLNVKAFEPTCSIRSISPPRAWRCLTLGPHPPPTMRSCFIGTGRGGVIVREIVASCVQAPPPPPPPPMRFVLRLRLQKGGHICGTLRYNSKRDNVAMYTHLCSPYFQNAMEVSSITTMVPSQPSSSDM